jgi:hypothetical protein
MAHNDKPPVTAEIDRCTLLDRSTAVAAHYQAIVDDEQAARKEREAIEREEGIQRRMTFCFFFKRSREKAEAIYLREEGRWLGHNWPTSAQYRLSRAESLIRMASDETLTSIRIPENDIYLLNVE